MSWNILALLPLHKIEPIANTTIRATLIPVFQSEDRDFGIWQESTGRQMNNESLQMPGHIEMRPIYSPETPMKNLTITEIPVLLIAINRPSNVGFVTTE